MPTLIASRTTPAMRFFAAVLMLLPVIHALAQDRPAVDPKPGRQADRKSRPVFNPRKLADPFRPIVDAPVITTKQVTDQVTDNELVLGVVVNGEARAYPINMLTGPRREIINDRLGGRAIAATW